MDTKQLYQLEPDAHKNAHREVDSLDVFFAQMRLVEALMRRGFNPQKVWVISPEQIAQRIRRERAVAQQALERGSVSNYEPIKTSNPDLSR
jgi:hypothetical protein